MKRQNSFTNLWQEYIEKSFSILVPLLAILAAFFASGILIAIWGSNPLEAYAALFSGAFGSPSAIATTLIRLTPLAFTGLAVAYGYRSGFFNVGAEGQLFMGALAATWVGVTFVDWPGWLLLPACLLAAGLAGACFALIPGVLKATRGFNEVLTTLLLNYIAIQFFAWSLRVDHPMRGIDIAWSFVNWLGIKDPSQPFPKSAPIAAAAELPSLEHLLNANWVANLFGSTAWYQSLISNPAIGRITMAPLLAILAVIVVYIIFFKTSIGYQARAVGINPTAAKFMGINVKRTIIITAFISGSLAGLAGAAEVLGTQHRIIDNFLVDAGFTGIPVALIGQLHPVGAFLSAVFFGALRAGANKMQIISHVPISVVYVIQSFAILFAIAGTTIDLQSRLKIARLSKQNKASVEAQPVADEVSHA
ncbi:MAG: ABC transporter permease [Anaerolineaceae bacterium]|nr:ABC transporter permease [Anaerolineaceae bacterium]